MYKHTWIVHEFYMKLALKKNPYFMDKKRVVIVNPQSLQLQILYLYKYKFWEK